MFHIDTLAAGLRIEYKSRKLSLRRPDSSPYTRKPTKEDIKSFKATEFRQFLVYVGRVFIKGDHVDGLTYEHFFASVSHIGSEAARITTAMTD